MGAIVTTSLILVLISAVFLLGGIYLLMGLCCKGSLFSKVLGGTLSFVGVAGYFFSIFPTCY